MSEPAPRDAGPPPTRLARDSGHRLGVALAGLTLLAATIGGLSLAGGWEFSPYDEAAHVDYAWKVAHGELPYAGATIEPEILREWSCHGQSNVELPPCGSGEPPAAYPARGENYLQHPPTYYAITGFVARALPLEFLGADFTTSARTTSIVWLALGIVLLYRALRVWRVPWHVAALAAALPPCFDLVLVSSITVTNDVTALPAGAVAILLLGRIVVEKRPSVLLVLGATALFTSMKVLNALPFLGIAAVVLLAAVGSGWAERLHLRRRTALALGAGIVGVVAAISGTATIVRQLTRVPNWQSPVAGINSDEIAGLPVGEWFSTLFAGLTPSQSRLVAAGEIPDPATAWGLLLHALVWAAPLGMLVAHRFLTPGWALAAAVALASLALPMAIQLQTFVSSGGDQYFPTISARYALSLLPLQIACLALITTRRRWYVAAVVVVGGAVSTRLLAAAFG